MFCNAGGVFDTDLQNTAFCVFFKVLVQPFHQLKNVRRCEAQAFWLKILDTFRLFTFFSLASKLWDKPPSQALQKAVIFHNVFEIFWPPI